MSDIKDKLARYAALKATVSAAEDELEELKPEIMEHLAKEQVEKLPTTVGTFTIGTHTTWKYSKAVEKLQEEEKARGIAEQKVTHTLRFTPPKAAKE